MLICTSGYMCSVLSKYRGHRSICCACTAGLTEEVAPDSKAAGLLTKIIAGAFAGSDGVESAVRQSLASMPARAKTYIA